VGRTPRAVRPTRPCRSAAGDHQRVGCPSVPAELAVTTSFRCRDGPGGPHDQDASGHQPGRGQGQQVADGQQGSPAGSPTRVKGLEPSRPTPARLAVASRSSSRPPGGPGQAGVGVGPGAGVGACVGVGGGRPGPGGDRGVGRTRRSRPGAPGPERGVGRGQAGYPGPDPDAVGAAGPDDAAGAGLAAAADQAGQDPAVRADADVGRHLLGAGGAGGGGQQAPAQRGRAECTLDSQVHEDLSFLRVRGRGKDVARGRYAGETSGR
jgi:hypothetical protein